MQPFYRPPSEPSPDRSVVVRLVVTLPTAPTAPSVRMTFHASSAVGSATTGTCVDVPRHPDRVPFYRYRQPSKAPHWLRR